MSNILVILFVIIFILVIAITLIITLLKRRKKKTKYKIVNGFVGDKLDVGIIPNDSYPKQDNDINNMF